MLFYFNNVVDVQKYINNIVYTLVGCLDAPKLFL